MCGRYYLDNEVIHDICEITHTEEDKFSFSGRDIYPGNTAPILIKHENRPRLCSSKWGFPGLRNFGLIINARAETLLDKQMFKNCAKNRRAFIPARHFYEWNKDKNKFTIMKENHESMYLAGIYNEFSGEPCFVIITTAANDSISSIHGRMPLIIEKPELYSWLFEDNKTEEFLKAVPVPLKSYTDYTQLKFDL